MTAIRLRLALLTGLLLVFSVASVGAATTVLTGCWEMRDSAREIALRAEDPFYASMATYCFDETPGELVYRVAEFGGFKDEAGNWVDAGGDGWDGGGPYTVVGDRVRIKEGEEWSCAFDLTGDVLTLSHCDAGDTEDITVWDRVKP